MPAPALIRVALTLFLSFGSLAAEGSPALPLQELPEGTVGVYDTHWSADDKDAGRPADVELANGYIYVGGWFDRAVRDGQTFTVSNLIRIRDDGLYGLDETFLPALNGRVWDMVLSGGGDVLYVVGEFTKVGSSKREHMAAFDTGTGELLGAGSGFTSNNAIRAVAREGESLYIGGLFTLVDGEARNRAAKLDVVGDRVVLDPSWNPNVSERVRDVEVLNVDGPNKVALMMDPAGTVGGRGPYEIAVVDSSGGGIHHWTGFTGLGMNVILADDVARLVYAGTRSKRLDGGNRVMAYRYSDGAQVWSRAGDGDVQGLGKYRGRLYVGHHGRRVVAELDADGPSDEDCLALVGCEESVGAWVADSAGALQPAPWRSQFTKDSQDPNAGLLKVWGFKGDDATGRLFAWGDFTLVSTFDGSQSMQVKRLAIFSESPRAAGAGEAEGSLESDRGGQPVDHPCSGDRATSALLA